MEGLTSVLAASTWVDGPTAIEDAVAAAVAALGGPDPSLVLLFPDASLLSSGNLARASVAARDAPVAGMSSDGLLSAAGARPRGCAAAAFGPDMSVGVGIAHDAAQDPRRAGRAAAEQALRELEPRPGHTVLLLFVDPSSGDEALAIDGAYSIAGGQIPMAGGGANGSTPAVIAGGEAHPDAVVAVGLVSERPIAVATAHGCRPLGDPAIATRTEGRSLRELNGLPAEDVYLEGLGWSGVPLGDREFEALAVLHPLGQSELRGQVRLRHVRGRAPMGGLECATPIPPNSAVWFAEQTPQTIVESATAAVDEVLELLGDPPRAALIFDCAARKRALGPELAEEADAVASAFGHIPALTGLYTRGEVGRTRGAKGDRNHAIVVVGFA